MFSKIREMSYKLRDCDRIRRDYYNWRQKDYEEWHEPWVPQQGTATSYFSRIHKRLVVGHTYNIVYYKYIHSDKYEDRRLCLVDVGDGHLIMVSDEDARLDFTEKE